MSAPNSSYASLQQTVENRLQSYARFGVDLGLDRIEAVLSSLGNPHHRVPVVHVAGTNGKGSVCAYLSSVLTAAGYKTGCYTSPHLVDWRERIRIDDTPISWVALQTALDSVEAVISGSKGDADAVGESTPTQFEVFTAAAWQYFAQQQVDVAVVEVGLGGRLDATNVCDRPLATVIVSIGRDHWQRLGNTLAEIAGEKAGILKPNVPAIIGALPAAAESVVKARASQINAPLTWVQPATERLVDSQDKSAADRMLSYGGISYRQSLLGDHQRVNSACAIAVLQALRTQGWAISDTAIAQGMANVRWPGRLQQVQWQGHRLLIDGAHNQAAARSLRAYLDRTYSDQPITWLIGMLQTKDHEAIFKTLLRPGDRLHLTAVPGHLSADPKSLSVIAHQVCPDLSCVENHPDLETALTAAVQVQPTVFCGSLYLIGHFFGTLYPSNPSAFDL
ncbi:folylpolyglutamate synthase/dihydrofolate synthase family protein [cf. Phormidesmis sp. LEGE 11477]|uniref:bifunctional folylpolyglutamate synthase/dihydrofolate synthase n=1 Tax=cf. Phormidesmis sp. LEGE 11477 TaxID=1828680 RepID=UPI0018804C6E|nr:folylpolyglutamate synthase/dihydrofolate synthase family protein [cf. Phormidesmis sp. LEGE 11477]MBE9062948.1 bifunctional folylpolyglutamate synthase/dihydrofolate synthase [cf. Phormidesmis sp. LEGE 11477]